MESVCSRHSVSRGSKGSTALRILVVSHSCARAINQQVYAEIARQTGWEFTLLVPADWRDEFGNHVEEGLWPGFKAELVKTPVFRNGDIILHAYRRRLQRWLCERHFEAIYVNHEPYALATAQVCLANRGRHRVPLGFYSCQNINKRYPLPFRWLERWVYRSSQFAFPITEAVAVVLRDKGYRGSMTVAPLPLDPQLYRPRPPEEAPNPLQARSAGFLIGYVGRMVEAKGLRTLVRALQRLRAESWMLAVIGTGPFEEQFDTLVREEGIAERVLRLGFVPHEETPCYLAAFDVLVVPSETQPNWKEQFGRVIVEALACGTPVIGSDSGEIPNLISRSGGGVVFPERNAEALAAALRRMMHEESLRSQCGVVGRRWAKEQVSVEAVAGTMAGAIQEAVVAFGAARR